MRRPKPALRRYTGIPSGPRPLRPDLICLEKSMRAPVLAVFVSLLSAAAFAQSDKGTLTGTVSLPAGGPAVNATVQAKNTQSGAAFKGTTAKDGRYSIADLPAGSYDVAITLPAVTGFNQKAVAITA